MTKINPLHEPLDHPHIKAPISIKFIYLFRHLLNTQNLFLGWERRSLKLLHKKYKDYPDGNSIEIVKIENNDFDVKDFLSAGNKIMPFVIRNYFPPTGLTWDKLKNEYGDTQVPTHPNAVIGKNFAYGRASFTNLQKTIEQMEQNENVYVIATNQVFLDHDDLDEQFSDKFISSMFKQSPYRKEMFIGGPKVGSGFHCAGGNNFFHMAEGRKKWIFVSPKNYMALYPTAGRDRESNIHNSEINTPHYDNEQKEKFPLFSKVNKYVVILEPGDLLFNPPMWWHEVHNLEQTIGVPHRALSNNQRRYELLSWLLLLNKGGIKYLFHAMIGKFTKTNKHTINTDETIILSYGGGKKKHK